MARRDLKATEKSLFPRFIILIAIIFYYHLYQSQIILFNNLVIILVYLILPFLQYFLGGRNIWKSQLYIYIYYLQINFSLSLSLSLIYEIQFLIIKFGIWIYKSDRTVSLRDNKYDSFICIAFFHLSDQRSQSLWILSRPPSEFNFDTRLRNIIAINGRREWERWLSLAGSKAYSSGNKCPTTSNDGSNSSARAPWNLSDGSSPR